MAEVVRQLRKQGAKNREVNQSVKDVMKMILENRKIEEEKRKEEFRAKMTNKCLTCDLFEPHIDDKSPVEIQEEVEKGNLKREKDNCSKWLCNNGACLNYPVLNEEKNS